MAVKNVMSVELETSTAEQPVRSLQPWCRELCFLNTVAWHGGCPLVSSSLPSRPPKTTLPPIAQLHGICLLLCLTVRPEILDDFPSNRKKQKMKRNSQFCGVSVLWLLSNSPRVLGLIYGDTNDAGHRA